MIDTDTGFWMFAAGAVGTGFCLFVIGLIFRALKAGSEKRKQAAEKRADAKENEKPFERQVISRIVAQHTDAILSSIEKTVQAQRENVKNNEISLPDFDGISGRRSFESAPFTPAEQQVKDRASGLGSPYDKIAVLRKKGTDENEISRNLMIPRAEVSLYLKMNPVCR